MISYFELRKSLAKRYPTEDERRMVANDLGLDADKIALQGKALPAWHNILKALEARGWLDKLRIWIESEENELIPVFDRYRAECQAGIANTACVTEITKDFKDRSVGSHPPPGGSETSELILQPAQRD